MIKFERQNEINVYVSNMGFIVFKEIGEYEEDMVCLTIEQFKTVMQDASNLIAEAEFNKLESESDDVTDNE